MNNQANSGNNSPIQTPNYIKSLLMPTTKKSGGRKVWSIDLETVWLPFLTATNIMGDTAIPHDAMGCPIRLAYAKDGSVKFSQSGKPITRVVKELSDTIKTVRENFTANLIDYAEHVATEKADAYTKAVKAYVNAGKPIQQADRIALDKALREQVEAEIEKAEKAESVTEKAEPEKVTV